MGRNFDKVGYRETPYTVEGVPVWFSYVTDEGCPSRLDGVFRGSCRSV